MNMDPIKQKETPRNTGRMSPRVFFRVITSAPAGFLFGFDTIAISGAEQTLQKLWGLSPGQHGLCMQKKLHIDS